MLYGGRVRAASGSYTGETGGGCGESTQNHRDSRHRWFSHNVVSVKKRSSWLAPLFTVSCQSRRLEAASILFTHVDTYERYLYQANVPHIHEGLREEAFKSTAAMSHLFGFTVAGVAETFHAVPILALHEGRRAKSISCLVYAGLYHMGN